MFTRREYEFKLTGKGSLLMHNDNFIWADSVTKWLTEPANKKRCTSGDDRTPGFIWLGHCYRGIPEGFDEAIIAIPTPLLSASIRDAGKMTTVPGRGKLTYKSQTQSGMKLVGEHLEMRNNGEVIPWSKITPLASVFEFDEHVTVVEDAGFKLNVGRVKVNRNRHIRVRPVFSKWTVHGVIGIEDDSLTEDVVRMLITNAGMYKGLGDWRPGAPTPGPYGTFELTKLELV